MNFMSKCRFGMTQRLEHQPPFYLSSLEYRKALLVRLIGHEPGGGEEGGVG
jgi:hypothetical protein